MDIGPGEKSPAQLQQWAAGRQGNVQRQARATLDFVQQQVDQQPVAPVQVVFQGHVHCFQQ